MATVTFTLVGNLADFGADPRAGVRVRIVGTPRIKVDDGTIYSDQPETVTTDSTGAFTADLISTPGLWYQVTTPFVRAINPVHVAAYTPDPDDPTTGVAFAAGVTVDLADVMDEDPTPGYDGVFLGGGGGVTDHGNLTGLDDDDHPQYLNNTRGDARYIRTINGLPADVLGDVTVSGGGGDSTTVTGGAARALVFAAVALASCDTAPAKFMFCGDSLTATNRWPTQFVKRLTHSHLPGTTPLTPTATVTAGSISVPSTGIYGVTCAVSGALSSNYASNNNLADIAATLQPHVVFHCIGTNDHDSNVAPATFKSNVVGAINAIDAVLTKPAVHVLHHFSTSSKTGKTYTIDDYMTALIEIAEASPGTRVAVDLGPFADTVGIQGTDPYSLDAGDSLHLVAAGDRVWGDLMARIITDAPVTGVLGYSRPSSSDATAPTWSATLTTGTPTETTVPVTASALATDNVAVTAYEASTDSGATWAATTPSGSVFTLTGLTPSTAYPAPHLRAKDAAGNYSTALIAQSFTTAASGDTTPPTVGSRAASSITSTGFTLTVTGASDAVALHATPYAFTTDGGATWTAYQSSAIFVASGLTASTGYSTNHRVRDAAGNVSTGTAATVTTTAADVTAPTVGTRAASSISSTGFTMTVTGATDETALHATPYAFTTDGGTTWSAYQSGAVYVATGLTGSTGYSTNHRVRDAAGNVSTGTAATVTTSAPVTPFTDNFNRADSATTLGSPWVNIIGVCGISGNQAYRVSGTAIAGVDFGQIDMLVSHKVVVSRAYFAGPAARIDPTGTGSFGTLYAIDTGGSGLTAVIVRIVNSTATNLGPSVAFALGDTLGISCKEVSGGTEIKVFINGTVVTTFTDTAAIRPMGTYGGIRPDHSLIRIDDFSIVAP